MEFTVLLGGPATLLLAYSSRQVAALNKISSPFLCESIQQNVVADEEPAPL